MNKVVFVEVQESRGDVTRQPLQEQRVGRLGVALPTAVQVALHVTLRQEGDISFWLFRSQQTQNKRGRKEFVQTRGQNSMTRRYGVTSEHCAKHCRSAGCWRVLEGVDRCTLTSSKRDFH